MKIAKVFFLASLLGFIYNASSLAYNREDYGTWKIVKGDCDTRDILLIQRSIIKVSVKPPCKIIGGKWRSWYSGTVLRNPSQIDVDHLLSIKEIDALCGNELSVEDKNRFFNDLDNLAISTRAENRKKGSSDILNFKTTKFAKSHFYTIRQNIRDRYCLNSNAMPLSI